MALSDGLIAYWSPWLGSSGYRLLDRARSNHGTLTNMDAGTDWVGATIQGRSGYALDFDGTNDYVALPSRSAYQPASGDRFSIAAWIYPAVNKNHAIISHGRFDGYSFYIQGNFLEFAKAGVANTGSSASLTPITIGAWNHVAVTNTVNSSVQLYVNGVQRRSVSFIQTYAYTNELRIGDSVNENFFFNGRIAEVGFFSRLLTASEIANLYCLGPGWYRPYQKRSIGYAAAGFKAYWHRRQSQVIGGGLR